MRLGQFGRIVQEGSLYGLLFLLPFSKAAVEILFGFMLAGWLLARLDPETRAMTVWRRPALRRVAWLLVAYLVACALSIAVSTHPALSLRAFFSKWLEYLLFFVVAADLGDRPRVLRRAVVVFACSAVPVLFEGFWQERTGFSFFRGYRLDFFDRITGPYENPGDLATYLMVLIPVLLTGSMIQRGWRRLPGVVLLGTLVLALARTGSQGAWISLSIGLIVLAAANARVRKAVGMVLIALLLSGGFLLYRDGLLQDVMSQSEMGKVDRRDMWLAALGMIRDRPLLGHGLNTFMANYLDYWVGGQRMPRYAHNCYLQVAAETGIVGLLLFVALLWLLFRRLFDGLRRIRGDGQTLLAGFAAGLLAFALQAAVDTNFYSLRQAALFWVLSGLALGFSQRGAEAAADAG